MARLADKDISKLNCYAYQIGRNRCFRFLLGQYDPVYKTGWYVRPRRLRSQIVKSTLAGKHSFIAIFHEFLSHPLFCNRNTLIHEILTEAFLSNNDYYKWANLFEPIIEGVVLGNLGMNKPELHLEASKYAKNPDVVRISQLLIATGENIRRIVETEHTLNAQSEWVQVLLEGFKDAWKNGGLIFPGGHDPEPYVELVATYPMYLMFSSNGGFLQCLEWFAWVCNKLARRESLSLYEESIIKIISQRNLINDSAKLVYVLYLLGSYSRITIEDWVDISFPSAIASVFDLYQWVDIFMIIHGKRRDRGLVKADDFSFLGSTKKPEDLFQTVVWEFKTDPIHSNYQSIRGHLGFSRYCRNEAARRIKLARSTDPNLIQTH